MSKKMNAGDAARTMIAVADLLHNAPIGVLYAVKMHVTDKIDHLEAAKKSKAKAVQP
jgi:hypothetical protein